MRQHRFIGPFNLKKKTVVLEGDLVKQIARVFRAHVGDELILGDGKGSEAVVVIENLSRLEIVVRVKQVESFDPAPDRVLYCAVLKKNNMELVVQKATECGVTKIIPILTDRTIKQAIRIDRLTDIAREASEQSGRVWLPEMVEPLSLHDALKQDTSLDQRFVLDQRGELKAQDLITNASGSAGVFIGPEGGWSENELQLMKEEGVDSVNLGKQILRAETAAIVASFLLTQGN